MPAAPARQYCWVVDLALVVIVVCIGGVVLGLFMSCFALLVSWLFASLKYSYYLCWQERTLMSSPTWIVVPRRELVRVLSLYLYYRIHCGIRIVLLCPLTQ